MASVKQRLLGHASTYVMGCQAIFVSKPDDPVALPRGESFLSVGRKMAKIAARKAKMN